MESTKSSKKEAAKQDLSYSVISIGTTPAARSHHTATLVPGTNNIILYGGSASEKPQSEVFCFDVSANICTEMKTSGVPPARSHHASVIYDGHLFVIGGWDGGKRQNDIWKLNLTTLEWTQENTIASTFNNLTGHSGHTATMLEDNSKLIVIGRQSGQRRWADTHSLDMKTKRWNLENSKVKSRSGHSSILFGDHIYIWGGRKSNDMDILSIKTLTCGNYSFAVKEAPIGTSYQACSMFDKTQVLMYGGLTDAVKAQNSIHILDLNKRRWTMEIPPKEGTKAAPTLHAHTMTWIDELKYFLVFGGLHNGKPSNKIYQLCVEEQ